MSWAGLDIGQHIFCFTCTSLGEASNEASAVRQVDAARTFFLGLLDICISIIESIMVNMHKSAQKAMKAQL